MVNELEYELALEDESALLGELKPAIPAQRKRRVPPHPRWVAAAQKHRERFNRLMRAIEAMRNHVVVRNGRLHFTLPARSTHEAAAKLGINHRLFAHLHEAIRHRNMHAHRFGMSRRAGSRSRVTVSAELEFEANPTCAGVTKIETLWWGIRVWLDECKAGDLSKTLKGGAVVATPLCVALVGPEAAPLCGVLGALGTGEGYLIDTVDYLGGNKGVKLSWTWPQIAIGSATAPLTGGMSLAPIVTSQAN